MPSEAVRHPWLWHGVYGLVLAALLGAIYLASQRVDYSWRWERVPQYVLSLEGEAIRAPFDGWVRVNPDAGVLVVEDRDNPDIRQEYREFERLVAANGDLIFAGDVIAIEAGWKPGPLLVGLWITIKISLLAGLLALVIGMLAGLGRVASNPAARNLAATYVEIIRGTPLLVQLFIFYFFVGTVLNLSAFVAGVCALAVFTGAYVAEIIRAGIEAVPKGQMEAARSLGMSYPQAMRHVVLPQAIRTSLPPLAGQFINLIKDSSLVSVIAITDLSKAGREVVSSTFSPFEIWFTVALMYLVLTGSLSWWVRRLELRMAGHG